MIIDTHCHIMSEDQHKYPRETGANPAEWIRDLPVEEFLSMTQEAGVDRAVLVQAFGAYRYDNRYAADSAARHPGRCASVCIIDPLDAGAPQQLADCVTHRGMHGLRVVTWTDPPTLLDDPRTIPLWRRANDLRIPVCVLTTFDQVPRLRPVLERFPELRVALDHLGLPSLSKGRVTSLAGSLFDLARVPNFYGKFSSWTIQSLMRNSETACADFFRRLIDAFGPQRLMWGSNYPASHDLSYRGFVELARERLASLSSEEQRWLLSDTALSLWPMLRSGGAPR